MPRDPEHVAAPSPAPPAAAAAADAPMYTGWLSGAAGRLTRERGSEGSGGAGFEAEVGRCSLTPG
jgi:hypothetical protein